LSKPEISGSAFSTRVCAGVAADRTLAGLCHFIEPEAVIVATYATPNPLTCEYAPNNDPTP